MLELVLFISFTLVQIFIILTIFFATKSKADNNRLLRNSFYILCASVIFWSFVQLQYDYVNNAQYLILIYNLGAISTIILALSYLIFAQIIVNRPLTKKYLFILISLALFACGALLKVGFAQVTDVASLAVEINWLVYTVITALPIVLIVYAVTILERSAKHQKNDVQKKQYRVISRGIIFAAIVVFFGNFIFTLLNISPTISDALISLAPILFTITIGYSVFSLNIFDIRLVVARAIAYVFSLTIVIGSLSLITFTLANLFFEVDISRAQLIIFTIFSSLAVVAYQPVKRFFDKLSNKIFYRDVYDRQEFLNTINAKIVKSNDLYALLSEVSEDIKTTIKVDSANFYIDSSAAIDFHTAGTNTALFAKTEWSELLQDINKLDKKVITSESLEVEEDTIKLMRKLNIELVLKLTSKDENVGYLLLSERKSGTNFGLQDIQVLEILADELAITVQNAVQLEQIAQFNVTLQKKINNATTELQQSNEKLVKLDEAKDEFISMASHQLRTPLTSVKGYISMILEGDAGEINDTQKKFLDQAYISSQRMVYLIADLLNVSRLKTGKFVIEKSPTYLPDVIESEVSQLYGTAEARDLKMIFHKPKEFPTIDLDETKIRQVIMNFADNAIYYTPHGGKITIELKKLKNSIEYTVTDTGIGVPKAEQHHLFNKFYRAANAKKARPDGTGLGLYMAKKVVVAQGGAIIFKTTEGKGSTFGFSFPLPEEEPREEEK